MINKEVLGNEYEIGSRLINRGNTASTFFKKVEGAMEETTPDEHADMARMAAQRCYLLFEQRRQGGIGRRMARFSLEFGRLMRKSRVEHCMSLEQLARRTELDPRFLLILESGLASSSEMLFAPWTIAKELAIPPTDLLRAMSEDEPSLTGRAQGRERIKRWAQRWIVRHLYSTRSFTRLGLRRKLASAISVRITSIPEGTSSNLAGA